jgi:hypothetical protein
LATIELTPKFKPEVETVPADTGKFRNVVPKATEDMLKAHQLAAWENQI